MKADPVFGRDGKL